MSRTEEADPLAGEDAPRGPCDCEGGMRRVQEPYALERCPRLTDAELADHVPDPDPTVLAHLSEKDAAALVLLVATQRAVLQAKRDQDRTAILNSWYPCKRCRPRSFFRWQGSHWDPDHDPGECEECLQSLGKRAARTISRTIHNHERRDLS